MGNCRHRTRHTPNRSSWKGTETWSSIPPPSPGRIWKREISPQTERYRKREKRLINFQQSSSYDSVCQLSESLPWAYVSKGTISLVFTLSSVASSFVSIFHITLWHFLLLAGNYSLMARVIIYLVSLSLYLKRYHLESIFVKKKNIDKIQVNWSFQFLPSRSSWQDNNQLNAEKKKLDAH